MIEDRTDIRQYMKYGCRVISGDGKFICRIYPADSQKTDWEVGLRGVIVWTSNNFHYGEYSGLFKVYVNRETLAAYVAEGPLGVIPNCHLELWP